MSQTHVRLDTDCMENSFITSYADYADIQYYMKYNPITN